MPAAVYNSTFTTAGGLTGVDNMIFPSTGKQILSALIHFLGVSILAHCLSRRITIEHLSSIDGLMQISWPRLCIILVFLDSWLFLFTGGMLIFGAGMELNHLVCSLGIDICIAFYATSKVFIYWFLIEKVYLVWSPSGAKRFKTRIYLLCMTMLALYSVVIVVIVIGRVSFFRDDGTCIIGLQPHSSETLLAYDLFINVFLTSLFLWPLLRSRFLSPTMKKVASRTLLAAVVALLTSSVNMLVLTLMRGKQLGWVCLGSCGTDVVLNALVLFWVTGGAGSSSSGNISTGATPGHRERPISGKTHGKSNLVAMNAMPSPTYPSVQVSPDKDAASPRNPAGGFDYLPSGNCDVTSPSNVAFLGRMSRAHESLPSPHEEMSRVWMESRGKSPARAWARFFRRNRAATEEHSLQIQVTTIKEMDNELDTRQADIDEELDIPKGEINVVERQEGEEKAPSLNGQQQS